MPNKFLALNTNGSMQEVAPTTLGGSSYANQIPVLNSNGNLDISMMPTGIGADTQSIVASESIAAGSLVNIYNNAGTVTIRNAIAADNTKPANGFVLSSVASAAIGLVYVRGLNSQVPLGTFVAANVGSKVFLSPTTAGGITLTIPTTTGQIVQVIGTVDAVATLVTINFTENTFTVRA